MLCLSVLTVLYYAAFTPKCTNCLDAITTAYSPFPTITLILFLYSGKRTETFGRYLFRAAAFLPVGERRHVSV